MSCPSINNQISPPAYNPQFQQSAVPQYQSIYPQYQPTHSLPSFDELKLADDQAQHLIDMTKGIAHSILPKETVPSVGIPQRAAFEKKNEAGSIIFLQFPRPQPQNTYIFGSHNTVNSSSYSAPSLPPLPAFNHQADPKSAEAKREQNDKTERTVIGVFGAFMMAISAWVVGNASDKFITIQKQFNGFHLLERRWDRNARFFDSQVNTLMENITPPAKAILGRQKTDIICKLACASFYLVSGGLLVAGAYYKAKEFYGPALLIGGVTSLVALGRAGYRYSSTQDKEDAQDILGSLKEYYASRQMPA